METKFNFNNKKKKGKKLKTPPQLAAREKEKILLQRMSLYVIA